MPYEYKILSPNYTKTKSGINEVFHEEVEWLNSIGKDGWELIQIDHCDRIYYFKRLI